MRFKQAYQLYPMIPMQCKSKLPDEGFDARTLDIADNRMGLPMRFPVYCKPRVVNPNPSWRNKSSKHRVFVICDCGRHVPFGRMGQHYKLSCTEWVEVEHVS